MRQVSYRVGGHLLHIRFVDDCNDESLIPSFAPFVVDEEPADEQPLFVLTVDDSFRVEKHGDEIGQFDCGGSNHGVYQTPDGGYQFEVSDYRGELCSVMQANADFTQATVALIGKERHQRNFGLNNSLMMVYAFSAATKGTLLVHASVIRKDGKGYLMTAPSGTGKSTHTHLWYKNIPGCDLMNDDNPVVRVQDGQAIIYGSPWSGKTPCYRNIQAPIGAFVRIQQKPKNEIRRLGVVEAFSILLPAMSSMKWDARVYHGVCDTISGLIGLVGIYELGCLPDAEAAWLCYNTVSQG